MKILVSFVLCTLTGLAVGQLQSNKNFYSLSKDKAPLLSVRVKKTGPYFGYVKGRESAFELGIERQYKKVKIIRPVTHGVNLGFNYNFGNHVMGYQLGYWVKEGRFNITFGGDVVLTTNFDQTRFGLGPCLGYRLLGFHLQSGYHFLTPSDVFTNTNNWFIRLRFTLVNERDWDIDSRFSFKEMFNKDKKKRKK